MHQLTLFAVRSGNDNSNLMNLINSFGEETIETVHSIDNLSQIKEKNILTEWFGVFYDDEHIDQGLRVAIPIFLTDITIEVFKFYRKTFDDGINIEASISPRIFRKHIKLQDNSLLPIIPSRYETILNGWVLGNT